MREDAELEREALRILERSYGVPETERAAFVHSQTQGNAALRAKVERLLRTDASRELKTAGAIHELAADDTPPDRVGPWTVTGLIGKGGVGSVYRGERDDGAFDQTVAIKLVRRANATDRLRERLRGELRVLARLSHPGIATVLDGGELEDGRPYMIIEYIDGRPLTKALGEIGSEERLDVFDSLLTAISYAHAMGVVHRDLSPGNVLMRSDGVVKVIDFGLSGSIHDHAHASEMETAGYTAPERKEGNPGDERGDIYSLGRLLGLLMDGLDVKRSRDLGAIIDTATANEPSQRYRTVDELHDDFRRYRAALPVSVRLSPLIVAKRFAERYRAATLTSVGLIIAIAAGGIIASVLATRASVAEARAIERADDLRALAKTVMTDLYESIDGLPQSRRAQEEMLAVAQSYLTQLEIDPRADSDLALDVAEAYLHLAWMAGDAAFDLQFEPEDANRLYQQARQRLDGIEVSAANKERYVEVDSWAKLWLGQRLAYVDFKTTEALKLFEEARNDVATAMALASESEALWRRRLSLNIAVAEMLRRGDDVEATRRAFERAIEDAEAAKNILDNSRPYTELSTAKRLLALVLTPEGRKDEVESLLRQSVEAVEAGYDVPYPRYTQLEQYKARAYHAYANFVANHRGDDPRAVELFAISVDAHERRRIMDPSNPNADLAIAIVNSEKALPLARLGRSEDAMEAFRPILEMDRANYNREPQRPLYIENMMYTYDTKARLHMILGEKTSACEAAHEVVELGREFGENAEMTNAVRGLMEDAREQFDQC
jgi:serine/threonine-protein kinase